MVNGRNGFTYAANIVVLSMALVLFLVVKSSMIQFRVMAIISAILGSCTTAFYIWYIRENKLSEEALVCEAAYKEKVAEAQRGRGSNAPLPEVAAKGDATEGKKTKVTACDWMKRPVFYIFGFVYMFARIALNSTATMMPFYLT